MERETALDIMVAVEESAADLRRISEKMDTVINTLNKIAQLLDN